MKREYKIIEFTESENEINKLWEQWWELIVWFYYSTHFYLWNYLVFKRPKK